MASRTSRTIAVLRGVVAQRLFRVVAFAVLALVLFGAVSGAQVMGLLFLFVAVRGLSLVAEALRGAVRADGEDVAPEPATDASATPPRSRRELTGEVLGLVTFVLLLPLALALYTNELVSLRSLGQGYGGAVTVLACVALYAWPHRWPESEMREERRVLWWSLPLLPVSLAVAAGVAIHHPYLNPLRADRAKLRAERVLSLRDNVRAGAHADWVFEYAFELERSGDWLVAIDYYRRGLELAPRNAAAHEHLRALEERLLPRRDRIARADPRPFARSLSPDALARLPFWEGVPALASPPPCQLDASLASLDTTTIVILRVGEVPGAITDAIADVLERELGLPACLAPESIALPSPTRYRGVVFGQQWSVDVLVEAFLAAAGAIPRAPIRILLVTGADIYNKRANYVFSSTYAWGAVLSYARFERFGSPEYTLEHRAAKQALGALVKSFGLPTSPDSNCVTSYSDGLPTFDAKGNRPNAETFRRFRERLRAENRRWRALRPGHAARGAGDAAR